MPQGIIGPGPNGDFFNQDIIRVRAFSDVPVGGGYRENLLLITTQPKVGFNNHQGVLWCYRACGLPELLFAVSIGPRVAAYAPSIDCRDGIIAVGRLTESIQHISVQNAIKGWKEWIDGGGSVIAVREPQAEVP